MKVSTSALIKYNAHYENNKLIKVEIDNLTVTENPEAFTFDTNVVGAYTALHMQEYLMDVRNKCKEFYDDSEVMRFVCDNIKKIINTTYGQSYKTTDFILDKCTNVFTDDGIKSVDQLKANDKIIGITGASRINTMKSYNIVKSLLNPATLMKNKQFVIFKEDKLTIKLSINDKDVAWINGKYITEFTEYDFGKLDYIHKKIGSGFKPTTDTHLLREFKTRLCYLLHGKQHKKYSLFNAIMDGRVLIINVYSNSSQEVPSIEELRIEHSKFFRAHAHACFQADFIAYKFNLGYYIAKNRFGEGDIMTSDLHVSMILDKEYA